MQRRHFLPLLAAPLGTLALSGLSGCGFRLRGSHDMAFRSIQLSGFSGTSPLATELARALEANGVRVLESSLQAAQAASGAQATMLPPTHIELQALSDVRDSVVTAKTAFGQVRTLTARNTLRFQVRRADGSVLLPPSDVALARDLSYNERDALAKQDESEALNRAMQTDIVQQVMRRLAAIRPAQLVAPEEADLRQPPVRASSTAAAPGPAHAASDAAQTSRSATH
jgi:LPS-assembly lipoprotein